MGQHGYSTSVRSQYPNSVSKNELSLYEELNYCLDVREFHLLIWILFFWALVWNENVCLDFTLSCEESSMFVAWVCEILHHFFLFYVFLKIVTCVFFFSQVFMFTVLSFLILNKLNFEYFYEYFSEYKYKNLFTDLWQYYTVNNIWII